MTALVAGSIVVAVVAVGLGWVCWRTRTALGGVLAAAGVVLLVLAAARGDRGATARLEVIGAAVATAIGAILFGLGHLLDRLLGGDGTEGAEADGDEPPSGG